MYTPQLSLSLATSLTCRRVAGRHQRTAFKFCATAADAKKAQLRINTKVNVLSSMALMEAGGRLIKRIVTADVQKEAAKLEQKLEAEAKQQLQVNAFCGMRPKSGQVRIDGGSLALRTRTRPKKSKVRPKLSRNFGRKNSN